MIVGPGWAFLGLIVLGVAALFVIPGCGFVVVDEAPTGHVRLEAPPLVEAAPAVEARSAVVATVSLGRAKRWAQRGLLRVRSSGCDDKPTGLGFALDPRILIAHLDVLPGANTLRVARRNGRARPFGAAKVYRLGAFGIARVDGRLPRPLPVRPDAALGASVAVVGYPLSAKPRMLRGVVVDRVAGAPFGIRGRVLRLTSALRPDEPGGPVIDARGRIVAVAFATDPRTGFAVAAPIRTLRALVARRALEMLPPCEGT